MKTPMDEGSELEADASDRASGQDQESPSGDDVAHLKRIDDYRQDSLSHVESKSACLGAMKCDLMEFGHYAARALKTLIAENPRSLYEKPEAVRLLETFRNLSRQTERFENLDLRSTELKKKAANEAAHRQWTPALDPGVEIELPSSLKNDPNLS